MNTKTHAGLPLVFVLVLGSALGVAQSPEPGRMVVKSFESLSWVVEYPGQAYSPEIAIVTGDPAKTPISMFIRMKKGALPMHSHSSAYQAVVVQGTMKHWAQGEAEAEAESLGPGSWWFQPAKQVHTDVCADEECLLYVHTTGKLDTIAAE